MSNLIKELDSLKVEVPDGRFVLPGSQEEIFFKPFTTADQKAMLKSMEKRDYELIQECFDKVLKKCVVNEDFEPTKLYKQDREALLIELRRNSVKEEYNHTWICKNMINDPEDDWAPEKKCGYENKEMILLKDLDYEDLNEKLKTVKIKMTSYNISLVIGNTTRLDEKLIYKYTKDNSKDMKKGTKSTSELLLATIASTIKSIEFPPKEEGGEIRLIENPDFEDKIGILNKLSVDDRNKIISEIDKQEKCGFNLKYTFGCKSCKHESEHVLDWMYFFGM